MKKLPTAETNPYLITIVVTIFATIAIAVAKYARGNPFDLTETLIGAVVFWVVYFLMWKFWTGRLKRK